MQPASKTTFERERGVTGVAVRTGLTHVSVKCDADGRLRVLQALAADNVPIFLLKLYGDGFSCVLRTDNADLASGSLRATAAPFERTDDVAMVSTLAGTMRDLSGVIARICDALIEAKVTVRQTGDAHDAVHCLVDAHHAERAAQAVRRAFGIEEGTAT